MVIEIRTQYIRLDQALKLAGLAQTGGMAKLIIQEQGVLVNGQLEFRRGRKLYPQDVIELEGKEILIL